MIRALLDDRLVIEFSLVGNNKVLRLFRNELGQHLSVTREVGIRMQLQHLGKACHTVAWFLLGNRDDLLVSRFKFHGEFLSDKAYEENLLQHGVIR